MNPWLERRVLNVAHQGGDHEAPSNTLYAFATAISHGAHMLEIDVHATADGHVVVCHDPTVDRTTNGSGAIEALTLQEIRTFDAAYRFSPGRGPSRADPDPPMRGIATGDAPAPEGFDARHFTIPTLEEVLTAFPDTFVSIDIKRGAPETTSYEEEVADLLEQTGATDRVIVASFHDEVLHRFRSIAPNVATSAATVEATTFVFGGEPGPFVLLQLPFEYSGTRVVTEELASRAHDRGIGVHVWTVNDPDVMHLLIEMGVEGITTDRPTVLDGILSRSGVQYQRRDD